MFLGKPGFREDIIVVFNYATITIDVQHIREDTNSIIKGLDGGNLEYSMGIRGANWRKI